jgi:tetratricopeptide (TPR) repeat protein
LAQQARGATTMAAGKYPAGLAHIRESMLLAEQSKDSPGALSQARNPMVMNYCYCAMASWHLGFPERAVHEVQTAVALANEVRNPLTLLQALTYAALVRRFRRETDAAEELVGRAHTMAIELGFPHWMTASSTVLGWIDLERGEFAKGLKQLQESVERDRADGVFSLNNAFVLPDLIYAFTRLGRYDDALAVAAETQVLLRTRLLGFGVPELHRLEGELWQLRDERARAEQCMERAITIARAQGTRSLELRALTSLTRLQGASGTAQARLSELYRSFPEGHTTQDLVDARALLDDAIT